MPKKKYFTTQARQNPWITLLKNVNKLYNLSLTSRMTPSSLFITMSSYLSPFVKSSPAFTFPKKSPCDALLDSMVKVNSELKPKNKQIETVNT